LADVAASDADLVAACDSIAPSLGRLSADEARSASAALLPGLTVRLDAALRGSSAAASAAVEASCRAMAALSDHADAAALARLTKSGAPEQLASLLRHIVPVLGAKTPQALPPFLAQALWLLGNVSADEGAAAAFTAAGGAALLVALLYSADAATLLHVCVAVASLSVHAGAAAALLRAGAIPALVRCLPPQEGPGGAPDSPGSLADAEAACRAMANMLRHSTALAQDAAQACTEIAASGAIADCTAVLWRASTDSLHVEFAARAVEVLLGIVGCAAAASEGPNAASTVVMQAAAAGTETAVLALLRFLGAAPSRCPDEDEEAAGLWHSLTALAAALRQLAEGAAHGRARGH